VVYGTLGKLNAARDNAVLLPSHYMATHHGYGWLIGDGRVFDPARDFPIATKLFGNGHTMSGPGIVRIALRGVRPGMGGLNIDGHTESPTQDASGLFAVNSFQTAPVWLQIRVLP